MPDATMTTPPAGLSRRGLMARAGLVGAAAALGTGLLDLGDDRREAARAALRTTFGPNATEKKFAVTDQDILTFALNTEYFEAEFYLRAVGGTGLAANLITGVGGYGADLNKTVTPGTVTAYVPGTTTGATTTGAVNAVPWIDSYITEFALELAQDEVDHVTALRAALGKHAPARPTIDVAGAWTTAMTAAGVIAPGATFDPYASERNFLLAAYFINDIGVTAYVGAAPYLTKATDLEAAAGILGVEAYHAGETRTVLFAMGQSDETLLQAANNISVTRNDTAALAGGPATTDQTLTGAEGAANIIPADGNSIAFGRTFPQLLSLFYLNTKATTAPAPGGFLPAGLNGRIR
jgi:hypothetical protein